MSGTPALDLQRVAKLYGRTAALKATSLQLDAGKTLALLGPNGSGKTTLLRIIAGAIAPTLGRGAVFGLDLERDRRELRPLIGFLAADTYLYDDLTAAENLRFALTMAGRRSSDAAIEAMLRRVGLETQAGERVRSFSSGMRRRLALGRVLLLQPRLLLLDEPYTNLDAEAADLIDAVVRASTDAAGAVVLATHDATRALALADTVAALERGVLRYHGSVAGYRMLDAQHVG
jgi:heme ABC exporter ATP-binding subunit CcmA